QRHVGVQLEIQRLLPGRMEEVEEAHVVRARVAAVARADAAVVDLCVQSLIGVVARVSRTPRFTRRLVAVLAEDGTELPLHVGELALPIALDPQPVHGAATRGLLRARGRNVVFGMAGDHAGSAACALIEIDGHSPLRHVRSSLFAIRYSQLAVRYSLLF